MKGLRFVIFCASWLLLARPALAQTPACDGLSASKKQRAQALFAAQHPYACCDETLAECLKSKSVCRLVRRLADNICRRLANGQSDSKIRQALARRANSMLRSQRSRIDLQGVPAIGSDKAKVVVVVYACGRCPFCAKITPRLYHEVNKGRLKDKVRLFFKSFPIRSHKGAKELGLAFVAAAQLGKFWPFLLRVYRDFNHYSHEKIPAWAAAAGMPRGSFAPLFSAAGTRRRLVASKREGIRNGVKVTPTFFIDGKRYSGELTLDELVDVLLEEWEQRTGLTH